MLQRVQGLQANSGDHEGVGVCSNCGGAGAELAQAPSMGAAGIGGEDEERTGTNNSGGNRWPRQETIALIKIRSDMDVVFRDSTLKGPLWEDVSRKMAELGYNRSSKKCKEKFENVYKYHKRTKDGRASKSDGKTYRFFDQLEALDHTHQHPPTSTMSPPSSIPSLFHNNHQSVTVSSPGNAPPNPAPQLQPPPRSDAAAIPSSSRQNMSGSFASTNEFSVSTSEEEPGGRRSGGRKRRWKEFFEGLMKDVMERQEEMQARFLDAMERRERDRTSREEAWRLQEMARLNREHDLLAHERSLSAAKDAALISFLQNITTTEQPQHKTTSPRQQQQHLQEQPVLPPPPAPAAGPDPGSKRENGGSSRWPKGEVEALIMLRTKMEVKYQENGPKGPLWEEISEGMRVMGYSRSSKRCKEKWENINKYFKKVKESNKKRPQDSKTCPYFHHLDALYREKAMSDGSLNFSVRPDNPSVVVPIMARPEQQWPLVAQNHHNHYQQQPPSHPATKNQDEGEDEEEDEDEYEEEEEDGDEGNGFEIVTNNQSTVATTTE